MENVASEPCIGKWQTIHYEALACESTRNFLGYQIAILNKHAYPSEYVIVMFNEWGMGTFGDNEA